ncbi:hypothetical protein Tco_0962189 [Tanacetum coccineum]
MSDLDDSTITYTEAPLLPDFVPEPVYPEFMPPEDEVFPAEEQPLPAADPEEDPEVDPTDYPADRGDDDNDDDESSDNDKDEEEEEEHPAPADSVPPLVHRVTARMSVRAQTPISLPSDTEFARLLAIPTLPPSPLSPLSSPLPHILSPLPQILSPPLPVSPPPLLASPTYPLGYRPAMIRLRDETPSTSHPLPSSTPPSGIPPLLPIPLPTPSPPLLLPFTVCREGVSEVTLPPQNRLCIALGSRYEVGKSSSAPTARPTGGFRADYGFVGTLNDEIRRDPVRYRMTDFVTTVRQDTYKIYIRLDDVQDERLLMSGQLNMLRRDRRAHARTARLMETKARLSCEAWVQSMDASDTARSETQVIELQSQQGPASGPTQPEIPEEAGSVADALAAWDIDRSMNGDDNPNSGTGVRRQAPPTRECTYPYFMKCKPLYFKGTEGVVELT